MTKVFGIGMLVSVALCMWGSGCSEDTRVETVTVSSEKVMCPSMLETAAACPLVTGSSQWTHVRGFRHEWGTAYVLRVKITKSPDDLADAPSEFLDLVDVLASKAVRPSTKFSFLARAFVVGAWDESTGAGTIGDPAKAFECADSEVRAALTSALATDEFFDLGFEYGDPVSGALRLKSVTSR